MNKVNQDRGTNNLIDANTKLFDENKWLRADNERLNNIINELLKKIQFYKTTEWGLRGYGILENFENILNRGDVKSDR